MNYLDEITEIWSMVKERMRQKLSLVAMDLWFGDITIKSFKDNTLTLVTPSTFKQNIICDKYKNQLEELFEEFMGFEIIVNIEASEEQQKMTLEMFQKQINHTVELTKKEMTAIDEERKLNSGIEKPAIGSTMPTVNFEYTFDNFIVGNSNKFAHAASIAVADRPAQDYNPLFIYGPSGLGKTHLLYAITNRIKQNNPFVNIIYIKGEDFTNQMIESLAKKNMPEFRNKYRKCDILLIDDIQFIAGKESTQEEFFHTFNSLYEDGKQIILTSDRPPKDIKTLEERLKTRFEWGLIADIQPPDLELRIAIFKNKISQAGIEVPNDVIVYLAENLRSHIRQIEGAVKKLAAIRYLSGKEITMEVAEDCINDLLGGAEPINVTVDKIFAAVEKKYNVKMIELTGKSRVKEVATARHITIYLIKYITEMSKMSIAKIFNRDHSTIISSIEAVEKQMQKNPDFESEINDLIKEIKE